MATLSDLLKRDAREAKSRINKYFSSWNISTNLDSGNYIFMAPNGSEFSTDTMYDDRPNTIELKKAKELYSLIVQYQEGSGDLELKHLREDKLSNY